MSDRLLRHIARNLVQLSELTYLDETTGRQQLYTGQAAKLLLVLADYANDETSEVWISERTMQRQTKLDGRTVQNFLKLFQESGLLRREGTHRNPNARPSNLYKVLPDLQEPEPAAEVTPTVTRAVTPTVTRAVTRAGALRTETRTETETPPPQELNTLVAVAVLYSKHALERQIAKGTEIRDPAAYLARLRKKVTEPSGEHHHAALRLIAEQPEASPEALLEALLEATGESPSPDSAARPIETALETVLGIIPAVFPMLTPPYPDRLRDMVTAALETSARTVSKGAETGREQLTEAIRGGIYEPDQPEVMRLMFDSPMNILGVKAAGYWQTVESYRYELLASLEPI